MFLCFLLIDVYVHGCQRSSFYSLYNMLNNYNLSHFPYYMVKMSWLIQSILVISNSKGPSETLRDIRTSTYQNCGSQENNKSNNHI